MCPEPFTVEDGVQRVRGLLVDAHLSLDTEDSEDAKKVAQRALDQIDDFILPRLTDIEAPLLAVVGGSTGAGKSTLVNSLLDEDVSAASAIRPTTRRPLLVANEKEMPHFRSDRVLGGLRRVKGGGPDAAAVGSVEGHPGDLSVGLHVSPQIPDHMALLDAPDIDSISDANRALAKQLLDAADLWLFVTTAARYADAAAWAILDEAAARGIVVGVVLNRVPRGAATEVAADLRALMAQRGLVDSPLFVIDESPLSPEGLLPPAAIAPLRDWLEGVVADRETRLAVARAALSGALRRLQLEADQVAAALETQDEALSDMRKVVDNTYEDATEEVLAAITDGSLLRSEVLDRWQDFVGTSDVFRSFEKWFAGMGDRVAGFFRGVPSQVKEVEHEITGGVTALLVDEAGESAATCWKTLRSTQAGRALFTDPALGRETEGTQERAGELVHAWQDDLFQLVRAETPKKRQRARALSLGLNTLTVALMLAVFASTGGLLGGELAIAGGSAVIGQKLLETIFGDQAIRKLTLEAAGMLRTRTQEFFAVESSRYLELIDAASAGTSPSELYGAARTLSEQGLGQ
mgnify:CR=1 FL=1